MTDRYHRGPPSDHFDGTRFSNLGNEGEDPTFREFLRWRFKGRRAVWPTLADLPQAIPEARRTDLRITMVGHATLLIQVAGLNILTDPVWADRASPVRFAGPRRYRRPGIALDRLPPIDAILLSHNHYDHLDIETLGVLHRRDAPLIVTPLGNDAILRPRLADARLAVGDWDEIFQLGQGVEAVIVPAVHWSSRTMRDRRMALWCGFLLRTPRGTVYFAGDTAHGSGQVFEDIRARHGGCDVALVPIGGYEPRWFMRAQHCDPDEAIAIAERLDATHFIGIHWGVFNLTDEPHDEPARLLTQAARRSTLKPDNVHAGLPGQHWDF